MPRLENHPIIKRLLREFPGFVTRITENTPDPLSQSRTITISGVDNRRRPIRQQHRIDDSIYRELQMGALNKFDDIFTRQLRLNERAHALAQQQAGLKEHLLDSFAMATNPSMIIEGGGTSNLQIREYSKTIIDEPKPKSFREELQQETDEWLKDTI